MSVSDGSLDVQFQFVITFWNNYINNLDWKKIWNLPARYIINNKVKEVSFQIIHRIYTSKVLFNNDFKKI